jgi:nucleotide-binding universal stress UspA family protein
MMYEMKKILVPTDFSPHAEAALLHAISLGDQFAAEITLLHVDEFSVSPLGARNIVSDAITGYRAAESALIEEQFALLSHLAEGRRVSVHPHVVTGRAYKAIVEESERAEYDLVVMATRGLTHLSSYLIGSTAERVVRLSRVPVLSIQQAPIPGQRVSSVLCPTDFSPAGNAALYYAISIARQQEALLFVQYVSDLERPESRQEIMKHAPNLEEHHPLAREIRTEYILDRDLEPSNSIIRFASDRDVSLIVMSAHGQKGLRRVYIGNNTAEVVRQSTRPVLTVTHPFHRKIFSRPLTEQARPKLSTTP